jgi:ethanolamine permease
MVSFVLLRRKLADAVRPYRSPVGVPGAVVAGAIAVLTFVGILFNPAYRPAIIAIAIVFAVGLALFAIWGRHRLVLSPEEEYAMSGGVHRDPEVEHYGSAELERDLPPEDFTR